MSNTLARREAVALIGIKIAFGASLAFGFAHVDIPAPAVSAMSSTASAISKSLVSTSDPMKASDVRKSGDAAG